MGEPGGDDASRRIESVPMTESPGIMPESVRELADEILRQETGLAAGSLISIDGILYPNPFSSGQTFVWFEDEVTGQRSSLPPAGPIRITGLAVDSEQVEYVVRYAAEQRDAAATPGLAGRWPGAVRC